MTRKRSMKPRRKPTLSPMHVFVNSAVNPPDQKARTIVASHMAEALRALETGVFTEKDKVLIESSVYAMRAAERAGIVEVEGGLTVAAVALVRWCVAAGWYAIPRDTCEAIALVVRAHLDTQVNMSHQDALRVSLAHERYYPDQFDRSAFRNLPMGFL